MIKVRYLLLLGLIIGAVGFVRAHAGNPQLKKINLSFSNDGLKFAGTLFVLDEKRPKPALIVAHGAGKEGRHLRGYQYMGRMFAEFGFATFIFDKRGVGESEGRYLESNDMKIPAGDLVAAVEAIKNRKEVDKERIGILGISQGGWTGPLAATMSKNVSFVVSMVGGGVSVKEQILYIRKADLVGAGWPEEKIKPAIEFAGRLFTYVGTGLGYEEFKNDYAKAAVSEEWFSFIKAMGFRETLIKPDKLDTPFFRALAYDPRETEGKINVPYLIILGEKDTQFPTGEAVKALQSTFRKSGFRKYRIVTLPNEGHNIFKVENGVVSFRDSFKKNLLEWLSQFKKGKNE